MNNIINNAEERKKTMQNEGKILSEKAGQEIEKFNEKMSRFSGGILSISLTIYLGMYKELDSEIIHILFFLLRIILLINLVMFVFSKYFYSYYLMREAGLSIHDASLSYWQTVIEHKDGLNLVDQNTLKPLGKEYFDNLNTEIEQGRITKDDITKDSTKYFKLYTYLQDGATWSFILGIVILIILLGNISFNHTRNERGISSYDIGFKLMRSEVRVDF